MESLNKFISKDIIDHVVMDYLNDNKEKYDNVMSELIESFDNMDSIHRINTEYGGYYEPVKPENVMKKYFAYLKEIKIIKKRMVGAQYIDFSGNNCEYTDNECAGWDGVSRRCECGNRRVDWEDDGCGGYDAVAY